jgi:P27 family predicted phage terminase small subunit
LWAELQVVGTVTGGRNGRPPKPAPLRLLEGNRGKRRVPAEVPPLPGPTDPPANLSAEARAVWLRLAPELVAKRLLAPLYVDQFFFLCESIVAGQRAAVLLAAVGPIVMRDGQAVPNPASREFARYTLLVRALAGEFGMSPASLTAMARAAKPEEDPGSPLRLLG